MKQGVVKQMNANKFRPQSATNPLQKQSSMQHPAKKASLGNDQVQQIKNKLFGLDAGLL